jgi:predicted DNA-binding transcriptional regulator YafY
VDRLLDPLGLVLKAGVWYLVAGGPTGAPRTYRVSRVLSLRTCPGRTHRPPDFSLAEFWRTRSAELRAALWRAEATVRLSPRGLELVPVLLGQLEARAVAESAGEPAGGGWVTATLPIESTRHAESVLLRLGADVEVLAPPELRERLAAVARALVARYDSS